MRFIFVKRKNMPEFGERLKTARLNKNMNQKDLADLMGMKQASISQFENGQRLPTPANIKKLASILNISPTDLTGESEGKFEEEILLRNIKGLSPESLKKINEFVDIYKKGIGK